MSVTSPSTTGVAENRLTPIPRPQIFSCDIGSLPATALFSPEATISPSQVLSLPAVQLTPTVQSFRFNPNLDASDFAR
jgi:hypothetical protein